MHIERHTVKRGHRFALASRGNDGQFFGRIFFAFTDINQRALRDIHISEVHGSGNDIDHASSRNRNLSARIDRACNDVLNTVNVGGECRDNHALILINIKNTDEGFCNLMFRRRISRTFHVRGFCHQKQNTFLTKLSKSRQIRHFSADGSGIDLEVARMHNSSERCFDGKRASVRNGMVHVDKFHFKKTKLQNISCGHTIQFRFKTKLMLRELIFQNTECQSCTVDRKRQLLKQERNAADMVFVSVCQNQTLDLFRIADQIRNVIDHKVNA